MPRRTARRLKWPPTEPDPYDVERTRERRGASRAGAALRAVGLAACLALGAGAVQAASDDVGAVRGSVRLALAGLRLADVAPVVVFLEGVDGPLDYAVPAERPVIHQRSARFAPSFLVVAAGHSVEMPNDDAIYHNVFSYSAPNDFDLGLYPAGESRSVTLRHPGVVKTYCSIHESMNATILVAPSRWFDTVSAGGGYALRDVPAGRYRLVVWSERLPRDAREIELAPGETLRVDPVLGASAGGP